MRDSIPLHFLMVLTLLFLASCKSNPEAKLHRAAFLGRVDEMKTLMDQGFDVNKNVDGETPFHRAVKGGHVDALTLLVEKGADTMAKDSKGRDAWDLAWNSKQAFIGNNDAVTLAFLLEHGYPGRITLLEAAGKADNALLMKRLIDGGEDVAQTDEYGWTPLHHAAYHSRAESCLGLLQAGADPNAESTNELSKLRAGGDDSNYHAYRYEVGSRPLDVASYGSARSGKSVHKVLEEWGGTENPEVDNIRRAR